MSGPKKSFIVHMNWKRQTEIRAGIRSGMTMKTSTCQVLAPSTRAASSMSRGMARRNCTSMKTKKASPAKAEGTQSGR